MKVTRQLYHEWKLKQTIRVYKAILNAIDNLYTLTHAGKHNVQYQSKNWDTLSHSSEWEGVSNLLTDTVDYCIYTILK